MAILANANEILIDLDGYRAYLTDDALYVYDADDTEVVGGYIRHNETDLGEPSLDKHINGVDVDYKGILTLYFYFDGEQEHSITVPNSASRTTRWVHFPVSSREPFQKIRSLVVSATSGTILYGLEYDFNVVQRRRSG